MNTQGHLGPVIPPGKQPAPTRHVENFHGLKAEYAENSILRAVADGRMLPDDAKLIREFIAEMKATKGISLGRSNKLIYTLVRWRSFVGPYRTNTIADLYEGIERLKAARLPDGMPFKQNTLRDFLAALKRFYLWLRENNYVNLPEKKLKGLQCVPADTMTKTAEQLLTEDEVRAMIDACMTSRDRALIAVLYDGALRGEEIGKLTWEQVKFDDYGAVLNVNEKTGHPRHIRIVGAAPYLTAWKNDYPCILAPKGLVFLSPAHKPMTSDGISAQLKKIGKRAGITKRITTHLFRHSRITHMVIQRYNESTIKLSSWGNLNTNMFQTYVHLTGTDIDNEVLARQGIHRPESERSEAMDPRIC
jgi:site-specific recombinase XerD